MPTQDQIREALRDVCDPELGIPILDLGLVYDIDCRGPRQENVTVTMTLTSPMCPVGPMFKQAVLSKVESVAGVEKAEVDITFDPPWNPREMASDDVKMQLGFF
jgi:metal-sulfur cluster biosynthetic enzyme